MTIDSHQAVLFFVQTQNVLLKVQTQLQFVASLLDVQHVLLCVVLILKVEHGLDPLVKDFFHLLRQARLDLITRLAQLCSFLLILPVSSENR